MSLNIYPTSKIALSYDNRDYSYQQLCSYILRFASVIETHANNFHGEMRMAVMGSNSPAWISAFFAIWKFGAVAVPIDPLSSKDELAFILSDCGPTILFVGRDQFTLASEAMVQSGSSCKILVLEELFGIDEQADAECTPLEFFKDQNRDAVIIYTSGTTGGPKGVVLSFRNLELNIRAVTSGTSIIQSDDRLLAILPFHHIFPLAGSLLSPLLIGAHVVIPSTLASDHLIECLNRYRITLLLAVPRFYALIHRSIRRKIDANLIGRILFSFCHYLKSPKFSKMLFSAAHRSLGGHLRHCICGGAAIDPEVERDFVDLGFSLLVGYGMSECAPMISFTRPNDIVLGSSGLPLPGIEAHSVDGEIWVKGENVMKGYWNRPEETSQVMENGFLKTGDLGHFDNAGRLFITGRKKEIIILASGKNINPEEIENKLMREHSVIEDMAVVFNQKNLHAIIIPSLKEMASKSIHNLHEFFQVNVIDPYNAQVAPYKRLVGIHFRTDSLPRTRLGKLRRHLLSLDHKPSVNIDEEKNMSATYNVVCDYLKIICPHPISSQSHLEIDLNLDSLDKINLLAYIQKEFGVQIEEAKLASLQQVSSLVEYIELNSSPRDHAAGDRKWKTIPFDDFKSPSVLFAVKRLFTAFIPSPFIKLKGLDHLLDLPVIYICNHLSFLDAAVLLRALPLHKVARLYFGAKQKHLNSFIANFFMQRSHIIPIDLNSDLFQSIEQMKSVLLHGKDLVLFPEGTRSRTSELGEFRKLFAQIACELKVPIVPIAIIGTQKLLPRGAVIPRFWTKLQVHILHPIFTENKSISEVVSEAREAIDRELKLG